MEDLEKMRKLLVEFDLIRTADLETIQTFAIAAQITALTVRLNVFDTMKLLSDSELKTLEAAVRTFQVDSKHEGGKVVRAMTVDELIRRFSELEPAQVTEERIVHLENALRPTLLGNRTSTCTYAFVIALCTQAEKRKALGHEHKNRADWIHERAVTILQHETGMFHKNDPRQNPLVFDMLLEHFKLKDALDRIESRKIVAK
ncbi:MAG: hypothetical protein NT003_03625 [Candidatus Magasanikbacteria bacterium]|nr:hypothetical protein [Candidatus Magasanikbacteria bacterium]